MNVLFEYKLFQTFYWSLVVSLFSEMEFFNTREVFQAHVLSIGVVFKFGGYISVCSPVITCRQPI